MTLLECHRLIKKSNSICSWVLILRLHALGLLLPPVLIGCLLGKEVFFERALSLLVLMILFCGYVMLSNDYYDVSGDRSNENSMFFSGGSRILVDGKLSADHVYKMSRLFLLGVLGFLLYFVSLDLLFLPFAMIMVALPWIYSENPFMLSHSPYGLIPQIVGVGWVLPALGAVAAGVSPLDIPEWLILNLMCLQGSVALVSAMPDQISDALCQKKTLVVVLGQANSTMLAICFLLLANYFNPGPWIWVLFPLLGLIFMLRKAQPGSVLFKVKVFSLLLGGLVLQGHTFLTIFFKFD